METAAVRSNAGRNFPSSQNVPIMLTKVYGAAVQGIEAVRVTIEVNCSQGIRFFMVGLPDAAVKESHERIVSAVQHNGYKFPRRQIVVNMSPADLRKEGAAYDLPLAIGILAAAETIAPARLEDYMLMGELSLDGTVLPIRGALPIAVRAREDGFKGLIVPKANVLEAAVVNRLEVYGVENIREVIGFLNGDHTLQPVEVDTRAQFRTEQSESGPDFEEVKGQENVKRAIEVAAAGGHNLIMIGPPGAGKSMMAKRIPSILPPLTLHEALETTKIHSVAGKMERSRTLLSRRPFRSPHHTISSVALVGGGAYPQPGEISLAHNGVLFLDELPEFSRQALEVLRQPLEDRKICISRARTAVEYPSSVMLVASMNPCPCGYYNHPEKNCICPPGAVLKYLNRISGPLLDRIDIQIEIVPVPFEKISDPRPAESSAAIRERVIKARAVQERRFEEMPGIYCNAQMTTRQLNRFAEPDAEGKEKLKSAMHRFALSARAYDRILKVARTIADLDGCENIRAAHIAEAVGYRNLDRENWAG